MKKNTTIAGIVILVVVVVVVGFVMLHKSNKTTTPTVATSSSSNAPAVNNAILVTKTDASVGQYLADPSGKPLYTYGGDTSGKSNCSGSCLTNWPAYVVSGSTTNLPSGTAVITRSDNGQKQYTYNGLPLYYFAGDSSGKVTGNNVENFKVAKPAAASSSPSSSSSTSPSTSSSTNSNSNSSYSPY